MHRRLFAITSLVALGLAHRPSHSQENSPTSRAGMIRDASTLVSAAAEALRKVAEGLKTFVVTGYQGYSFVAAKQQHERLKDISARATSLATTKQALVVNSIDEYLAKPMPSASEWRAVTKRIEQATVGVTELLRDIKAERSDLVLEEAYSKLLASLTSRNLMLNKLSQLPPPSTPEEREALAQLNVQYKLLLQAFATTIRELNAYILSAKKA
jgi:hypothetical protein